MKGKMIMENLIKYLTEITEKLEAIEELERMNSKLEQRLKDLQVNKVVDLEELAHKLVKETNLCKYVTDHVLEDIDINYLAYEVAERIQTDDRFINNITSEVQDTITDFVHDEITDNLVINVDWL